MLEHTAPRAPCSWLASLRWLLSFSLLAACGGGLVPVHNIQNAPVVVPRGQTSTSVQVRDAIIRALGSRNWQLNREGPDGIVASMIVGGHSATIRIQYDEHTYSIQHVDSSPGLKFNGVAIHRNYNNWIEKLNRSIRSLLMGPHWDGVQVGIMPPPTLPPSEPPPGEPAPATAAGPAATAPNTAPPPPPPPPPPRAAPPPAVAPPTNSGALRDDAPPPPPPPPPAQLK